MDRVLEDVVDVVLVPVDVDDDELVEQNLRPVAVAQADDEDELQFVVERHDQRENVIEEKLADVKESEDEPVAEQREVLLAVLVLDRLVRSIGRVENADEKRERTIG